MAAKISGYVCYCPELRLYQYRVTDASKPDGERETDFKFDDDNLEDSIATYLASEQENEAKFLAEITGLARIHPHKFVVFDTAKGEGEFKVLEPVEHWKKHDAERDGK